VIWLGGGTSSVRILNQFLWYHHIFIFDSCCVM
jgi:hypothetical protein